VYELCHNHHGLQGGAGLSNHRWPEICVFQSNRVLQAHVHGVLCIVLGCDEFWCNLYLPKHVHVAMNILPVPRVFQSIHDAQVDVMIANRKRLVSRVLHDGLVKLRFFAELGDIVLVWHVERDRLSWFDGFFLHDQNAILR